VLGERLERKEEKLPIPTPLLVLVLNETVGSGLVDHTTPLEVTGNPPSEVMFPPEVAEM
jgi:hypothetical protein